MTPKAPATELSPASLRYIDTFYSNQQSRTCLIETQDGTVVVKGQRPKRDNLRFLILGFLADVMSSRLMHPVPIMGGLLSQQTEVRRLATLADSGISVPRVLCETDRYFVMQGFYGMPLDSKLALPAEISTPAFESGLLAIAHVHRTGNYLSQAFARNILVNEHGGLWFIDHEDEPLLEFTLLESQARDYFLYLLSSVWLNRALWRDWLGIWCRAAISLEKDVTTFLLRSSENFLWVRHLPAQRKPLGRDILQAQALAEFLHCWKRELKIRSEGFPKVHNNG